MQHQPWLESLGQELAQRRLPLSYRQRLLSELAEHAADLRLTGGGNPPAQRSFAEALGTPQSIAETALVQYRQRRFAGRHPVAMFVLLPLPLALLIGLVLTVTLSAAGAHLLPRHGLPILMHAFGLTMVTLPFLVAALICCHVARKAVVAFQWQIISCAILAATAVCLFSHLQLPTETAPGTLMIGPSAPRALGQLGQGLVPLAVLGWSYRRLRRRPMQDLAAA